MNNTRDVSPARLIREARGLSQVNVAKVAGLSRSAYQNIETGKTVPRASTMVNIARALAVSVDDLLAPVAMPSQVRFRSRRRMRGRDSILLNTAKWLKDYCDLESIVGERIPWALSTLSEWAIQTRMERCQRSVICGVGHEIEANLPGRLSAVYDGVMRR